MKLADCQRMRPDGRGATDVRSVCGVLRWFLDDNGATLDQLEAKLWTEGLRVVTAADVAVLEAMGVVTEAALRDQLDNGSGCLPGACLAELARRGLR